MEEDKPISNFLVMAIAIAIIIIVIVGYFYPIIGAVFIVAVVVVGGLYVVLRLPEIHKSIIRERVAEAKNLTATLENGSMENGYTPNNQPRRGTSQKRKMY
ncbi:MAG: hypothetical protein WC520_01840 [Candidatus Paceibacterota bacterium]